MNGWTAFRFVPPIGVHAWAWATLSLATFLAAEEFEPVLLGRKLDPLALAAAVQLVLSKTHNMTQPKFARAAARAPIATALIGVVLFTAIGWLALYASGPVAAGVMIAYLAQWAVILWIDAAMQPEALGKTVCTWGHLKHHRADAVRIEACGIVICALTLLMTWHYTDPLGFALMMSFGIFPIRQLTNWVIVIFLLDRERDDATGSGKD